MLVEIEIAAELPFHKGERPCYRGPCCSDFVNRMGGLELHPVDASLFAVSPQSCDRVFQLAVCGIAGVALRHHHEIRIEFVPHIDCRAIARDRLVERHNLDARALRLSLALDRLVVDADSCDAGTDALPHHAAHRHDAAVTGVAVHNHRDRYAVRDPAGDGYTLGHRRGADIGKACIGTNYPAGTDE